MSEQNSTRKVKTIVVLGMHRSGTSMVGAILEKLGVNMGEKLIGKSWTNPLGHFEDGAICELNDRILEAAGGSWDSPPSREVLLEQSKIFSKELKQLIESKKGRLWGWKDPRTCLTFDLYEPYLQNYFVVVVSRNPEDVALSLEIRGDMEREKGEELARIYSRRIDESLEGIPDARILRLKYKEVITEPERWVKTICDFTGIKVDDETFARAKSCVLSKKMAKRKSLCMRFKHLLKEGLSEPYKIPDYIRRKLLAK